MLKGVSSLVSPDLLYALACMGHGDEIVLADANFPARSVCGEGQARLVDASGQGTVALLEAVLSLMPIDDYVYNPCMVMDRADKDKLVDLQVSIWSEYERVIDDALVSEKKAPVALCPLERFEFYERAKKAFVVVATSEPALYANIIVKKGVISPQNNM